MNNTQYPIHRSHIMALYAAIFCLVSSCSHTTISLLFLNTFPAPAAWVLDYHPRQVSEIVGVYTPMRITTNQWLRMSSFLLSVLQLEYRGLVNLDAFYDDLVPSYLFHDERSSLWRCEPCRWSSAIAALGVTKVSTSNVEQRKNWGNILSQIENHH